MDNYGWTTKRQSRQASDIMAIAEALAASYGGSVEFIMEPNGNYTVSFAFPDSVSEEQEMECAEKLEQAIVNFGGEVV